MEEVSFVPRRIHFLGKFETKNGLAHLYLSFVDDIEAKYFKHGKGEGQEIGFFTIDEALKLRLPPALKGRFIESKNMLEKAMKDKVVPQIKF